MGVIWFIYKQFTSLETTDFGKQVTAFFTWFGIPPSVVTDNGTCFTSEEFDTFYSEMEFTIFARRPTIQQSMGRPSVLCTSLMKDSRRCKKVQFKTK